MFEEPHHMRAEVASVPVHAFFSSLLFLFFSLIAANEMHDKLAFVFFFCPSSLDISFIVQLTTCSSCLGELK